MIATQLRLSGSFLIKPRVFDDPRGRFVETHKDQWFRKNVCDIGFIQDNQSLSIHKATVRGLHYQGAPCGQGKLVRCITGAILDICVDIRPQSETYGQWLGEVLTPENGHQLWVPEGFAHGFCTLEDNTIVAYKVTHEYAPAYDFGIAFDDPDIGIEWPFSISQMFLSDKDKNQPRLAAHKEK
jgi:dTDP-4-dehydrorhamnose 3,5-epimerase